VQRFCSAPILPRCLHTAVLRVLWMD